MSDAEQAAIIARCKPMREAVRPTVCIGGVTCWVECGTPDTLCLGDQCRHCRGRPIVSREPNNGSTYRRSLAEARR